MSTKSNRKKRNWKINIPDERKQELYEALRKIHEKTPIDTSSLSGDADEIVLRSKKRRWNF